MRAGWRGPRSMSLVLRFESSLAPVSSPVRSRASGRCGRVSPGPTNRRAERPRFPGPAHRPAGPGLPLALAFAAPALLPGVGGRLGRVRAAPGLHLRLCGNTAGDLVVRPSGRHRDHRAAPAVGGAGLRPWHALAPTDSGSAWRRWMGVHRHLPHPRHAHFRVLGLDRARHRHVRHRSGSAPPPRGDPLAPLCWLDLPALASTTSTTRCYGRRQRHSHGVFADILFIVAATNGTLPLVLGDDGARSKLARISSSSSPDCCCGRRKRSGAASRASCMTKPGKCSPRSRSSSTSKAGAKQAMVGRALAQVRDLSNLLRPRC